MLCRQCNTGVCDVASKCQRCSAVEITYRCRDCGAEQVVQHKRSADQAAAYDFAAFVGDARQMQVMPVWLYRALVKFQRAWSVPRGLEQ